MPSKPRDFRADEPVLVSNRCVKRLDLLNEEPVRLMAKRLLARYAEKCQVRVLQYSIRRNHLHLLVSQGFHGHDRRRKVGIAAFCRDVFALLTRYINGYLSTQGTAWDRTYAACIRAEGEEALAAFAYVTTNGVHHGAVARPEDDPDSGVRPYFDGEPDGVVTHILGLFADLPGSVREKGEFIRALVGAWTERHQVEGDRVAVARRLLCEHHPPLDITGSRRAVPMAEWAGEEKTKKSRRETLGWVPWRSLFTPRRAPKVGEVFQIVVQRTLPAPLARCGWRVPWQ